MPDSQSLSGTEKIAGFVSEINAHNVDYIEAQAAKEYFYFYHTGLNRRTDDLIEPYRAIVDCVAYYNMGSNEMLTKTERRALAHVLHNACMVDGIKVNVMTAIDMMSESLKRIILDKSSQNLQLPTILPVESMEGITE